MKTAENEEPVMKMKDHDETNEAGVENEPEPDDQSETGVETEPSPENNEEEQKEEEDEWEVSVAKRRGRREIKKPAKYQTYHLLDTPTELQAYHLSLQSGLCMNMN
jgi:hypothetical protein